ncbi:hypothetical protein FNV43_RR10620 [Rhamnella rubrinervis]|uniref:Uncharacterized protein n=1 Tax=Rhamnella rubrinervis TaxID=2594499 RepID=A0A8K0MGH5_9ROSA|nr:hypothetical protein FNV43_RR10620 [Rhamnella rubrinervis]
MNYSKVSVTIILVLAAALLLLLANEVFVSEYVKATHHIDTKDGSQMVRSVKEGNKDEGHKQHRHDAWRSRRRRKSKRSDESMRKPKPETQPELEPEPKPKQKSNPYLVS